MEVFCIVPARLTAGFFALAFLAAGFFFAAGFAFFAPFFGVAAFLFLPEDFSIPFPYTAAARSKGMVTY